MPSPGTLDWYPRFRQSLAPKSLIALPAYKRDLQVNKEPRKVPRYSSLGICGAPKGYLAARALEFPGIPAYVCGLPYIGGAHSLTVTGVNSTFMALAMIARFQLLIARLPRLRCRKRKNRHQIVVAWCNASVLLYSLTCTHRRVRIRNWSSFIDVRIFNLWFDTVILFCFMRSVRNEIYDYPPSQFKQRVPHLQWVSFKIQFQYGPLKFENANPWSRSPQGLTLDKLIPRK